MICIWKGYLCNFWDAVQFCRIIDNAFSWAEYILRPMISQYIDQWRAQNSPEAPDLRLRLKHDPAISAIVHRVEGQFRSLNIPDSSDFSGLVQMIVTLKEVIASTTQKTSSQEKVEQKTREQRSSSTASIQANDSDPAVSNPHKATRKLFSHAKCTGSGSGSNQPSLCVQEC